MTSAYKEDNEAPGAKPGPTHSTVLVFLQFPKC